jgi:hypothetical protein
VAIVDSDVADRLSWYLFKSACVTSPVAEIALVVILVVVSVVVLIVILFPAVKISCFPSILLLDKPLQYHLHHLLKFVYLLH